MTSNNNHKHNISDINVVNIWIIATNQETTMQVYEQASFVENITHIKLYNHFGALLFYIMQNLTYAENIFNIALTVGIASNTTEDMDQLARVYYNMGVCKMLLDNFSQSKLMFEQSLMEKRMMCGKSYMEC